MIKSIALVVAVAAVSALAFTAIGSSDDLFADQEGAEHEATTAEHQDGLLSLEGADDDAEPLVDDNATDDPADAPDDGGALPDAPDEAGDDNATVAVNEDDPYFYHTEGKASCTACHNGGDPDVTMPPTDIIVQAGVEWQRANGASLADWVSEGRGNHVEGLECDACHTPGDTETKHYPDTETCDSSCHQWLQETVTREGMPGALGTPAYEGNLDPETLLTGADTAHKDIFEQYGCTGFCHNDAITLAKADAWGADGTDPAIPAGTLHGQINRCTECHRFESPLGDPNEDMHNKHAGLLSAEKVVMDTSSDFSDGCAYCHSTGSPDDSHAGPGGGCYNCHLSGHRPETIYWG